MPSPASSSGQIEVPFSPSAEKRHATSSTEDIVRVPWKRSCTGPDSPSQEHGRRSPPPLPNPVTAPPEFTSAHPVKSEEVIQNILDALPTIPIYVRELKRQISTLQESNEMMESRILQLEKQYVNKNCANVAVSIRSVSFQVAGK